MIYIYIYFFFILQLLNLVSIIYTCTCVQIVVECGCVNIIAYSTHVSWVEQAEPFGAAQPLMINK